MSAEVWTVMVLGLIAFELVAVFDKRPRNTWSYWVWKRITPYLAARLVVYPLWAWLTWHWFLETWLLGDDPIDFDDLMSLLIGAVIAVVATSRRTNENVK